MRGGRDDPTGRLEITNRLHRIELVRLVGAGLNRCIRQARAKAPRMRSPAEATDHRSKQRHRVARIRVLDRALCASVSLC